MDSSSLASIVITNYNYGRFLERAIESALCQTYSPLEVIVVDDGSTDNSVEVLQGFEGRIQLLVKRNGGQASAMNAGFALSRGDTVIFLDSDDVLAPGAMEAVVKAFQSTPEAARVQYRMEVIDEEGNRTGITKPYEHLPLLSGNLSRHVLTFPFDIPWMPTSGNAIAAWVLRKILPIPVQEFRILPDFYLTNISALYGPVLFLDEILAYYRVHGANSYEQHNPEIDLKHIRVTISHSTSTSKYLKKFSGKDSDYRAVKDSGEIQSVSCVANRLVSYKLDPDGHPIKDDSLLKLFKDGLFASLSRFDVSWLMKAVFISWFAAMTLAPRPLAHRLAKAFFFPQKRAGINKLLGSLHRPQTVAMGKGLEESYR